MFTVPTVAREEIDSWPVEEAGLPTRVINSVRAAEVQTIGQLRRWANADLLDLRSLGKVSLDQINYFYTLCNHIENSMQRFSSIHEVLDIFLHVPQLRVMATRYGFHQTELKASRNWVTLQEIGNEEDKTRERIRQLEDLGKKRLRSRIASICLDPFFECFEAFIRQRSRAISVNDLFPMRNHEALLDLNPASILLLLSDLQPERILFHNGFFSTLPLSTINHIEHQTHALLRASNIPVNIDILIKQLAPIQKLEGSGELRQATSVVIDHVPTIGATIDERYFLYDSSVKPFLMEIMKPMESPVHYRTITNRFNEQVKPLSRKGAGYILDTLNNCPGCTRVNRGIYTLMNST